MAISTKKFKENEKRKEQKELTNALKGLQDQDTNKEAEEDSKQIAPDIKETKGFYLLTGKVQDVSSTNFLVNFRGKIINAYTAGVMRKHRIKVLLGDLVDVEIRKEEFEYITDASKKILGRIRFRHKNINTKSTQENQSQDNISEKQKVDKDKNNSDK